LPKQLPWQGEPLPRGRHKLDPEAVRDSQRSRISRAMLEVVAEHGYEATTVSQVVAAARVSRNSFYEFFTDKTDCFLTLTDELGAELLDAIVAMGLEPTWTEALRRGTEVYLAWWEEHEVWARAYFSGLAVQSPRALAQRQATYERFGAIFVELARRAREEQPGLPPLPAIVPRVLVFSITELVADEIRAGRAGRLRELGDELFATIVRLLSDDATARALVA
jgi:AcrR family transcriptional regulator